MFNETSRTKYDLNFSFLGVPICIQPFFWLIAVALGWTDGIQFGELFVWIVCVLVSILIHEFGHAYASKRFGGKDVRIVLHGMGGVTLSKARLTSKQRIIELISGPLVGFILFFLFFILGKFTGLTSQHFLVRFAIFQMIYINLVWGLLNLLPIYPMDGGQIMHELILRKKPCDGLNTTFKISMIVAASAAAVFMIPALIALFTSSSGNWMPVILFLGLGLMNYHLLKGTFGPGEDRGQQERQSSWEKDADWWKR